MSDFTNKAARAEFANAESALDIAQARSQGSPTGETGTVAKTNALDIAQARSQGSAAAETLCRRDCAFFSTYTESCDYTLVNYRARPCPATACTVYKQRTAPRSWQVYTGKNRYSRGERSVVADCGHDVRFGVEHYEKDGETCCAACVESELAALRTREKAELLGYEPMMFEDAEVTE